MALTAPQVAALKAEVTSDPANIGYNTTGLTVGTTDYRWSIYNLLRHLVPGPSQTLSTPVTKLQIQTVSGFLAVETDWRTAAKTTPNLDTLLMYWDQMTSFNFNDPFLASMITTLQGTVPSLGMDATMAGAIKALSMVSTPGPAVPRITALLNIPDTQLTMADVIAVVG